MQEHITQNWQKINEQDYFALPYLSSHGLMKCLKSYNHYQASKTNDQKTTSMAFGRLAHIMALEPDRFAKIKISPDVDRRTKEGKQIMADFVSSLKPDDVIATQDEIEKLKLMQAKLQELNESPTLKRFTKDITLIEHHAVRVFATDDEIGDILVKAKPDAIGKGFILDYKTTQDAWLWGFGRSARNYHYDLQLRVYQKLHELMTGELLQMVILAQETEPPYEFQVYQIPNEMNQNTDKIIETALQKYKQGVLGRGGYPREILALEF